MLISINYRLNNRNLWSNCKLHPTSRNWLVPLSPTSQYGRQAGNK